MWSRKPGFQRCSNILITVCSLAASMFARLKKGGPFKPFRLSVGRLTEVSRLTGEEAYCVTWLSHCRKRFSLPVSRMSREAKSALIELKDVLEVTSIC